MRPRVDLGLSVHKVIALLFLLILLTSHRDPLTGYLMTPRGWVAGAIFIGVAVVFFRDMLGRMGYRGNRW